MIWKIVEGFGNRYEVSDSGLIRNAKTLKHLKQQVNSDGYHHVCLFLEGKKIYRRLNRLVAIAFIPNPENKPEVNHKDGVKSNNNDWNLEWNTRGENQSHAYQTGLKTMTPHQKRKIREAVSRPVIQHSKKNEFIAEYSSITDAAKATGLNHHTITESCMNRRVSRLYNWSYKNLVKEETFSKN